MKILVIDDEECTRCLMESALRHCGHQVFGAPNGVSGMRILCREQPDIVVTDILMPEEDGLGLIRAMRRDWPAIKIIAISGGGVVGSLDLLEAAYRLGADETLAKPFEPTALLDSVRRCAAAIVPPPAE